MTPAFRLYIAIVSAAFWLGMLAMVVFGYVQAVPEPQKLAPLLGLAVASEALMVRAQAQRGNVALVFSATGHIAAAIVLGPVPAAMIAALAVIIVDGARLTPIRTMLINSAMFGFSIWGAGIAYQLAGGHIGLITAADIPALTLLIAMRFLLNSAIYAVGAVCAGAGSFTDMMRDELRDGVAQGVGEGSLGVLVAFAYTSQSWVIFPFLAPLLIALYTSSANFERLKQESRDVLNAFARVIDERDRSTAQHSERVADYVERFAAAVGLAERETVRLVDAARFHDLGKIAVDVATLSKEGRLSEPELRAIRRHPRLSARLLAPFHFAREMALYAELHHERYDGHGYYSVPQREIPVEAHVLIVADSFDAMTSARAYRSALSTAEAVQELRDKAGTQFHPLVALAFVAMIEGDDVASAIGSQQLAALQAEFSRVATVSAPPAGRLLQPAALAVAFATLSLVGAGFDGIPVWINIFCAGLAGAAAGLAGIQFISLERRRRRANAAIEAGRGPVDALAEAGIVAAAAWFEWDTESGAYLPPAGADLGCEADDLESIALRAVRIESSFSQTASGGAHLMLAGAEPGLPRLAVAGERALSTSEVGLVEDMVRRLSHHRPEAPRATIKVLRGDLRRPERAGTAAAVIVDLDAFEDVRLAAGQLSAERVVADAEARLRAQLRAGDPVVRLGDDSFGVVVQVADDQQLERVCARLAKALAEVPVPRRAMRLRPRIRSAVGAAAYAHPDLAAVMAQLSPDSGLGQAAG